MNKVLIVDDEFPARELLKMAIDWEKAGYEITGEAKNGQEAYRCYQEEKPDLIITDIQMPVMDGIELIRKIKEEDPEQRFVILSCHESFQYAQMAIKLGVSDYLLKDSYTSEELYLLLRSMAKEKERTLERPDHTGRKLSEYMGSLLKRNIEVGEVPGELKEYFFKQGYSYYIAVLREELIDAEGSGKQDSMQILGTVDDIAACRIGENRICYVGRLCSSASFLQSYQARFDSVVKLKNLLESRTWYRMSMGVSQMFEDPKELCRHYREANKALDYMVFKGREKIVFFENIDKKREVGILEKLSENFKKLQDAMERKKAEEIRAILRQIYEKDIQGMMQCNYLYYTNSLLFGYLTYLVTKYNISLEQFYEEGTFSITGLNEMESCMEMEEWIYKKTVFILEHLEYEANYSPISKKAISYLEENYSNDISIENMADMIGVNKSYLSRVFKAEVGRNISVYLNELRISKAILLMEKREYKTMDIVYAVGYNSVQNYYHAFRQVTGMTPKEYRENKNNYFQT